MTVGCRFTMRFPTLTRYDGLHVVSRIAPCFVGRVGDGYGAAARRCFFGDLLAGIIIHNKCLVGKKKKTVLSGSVSFVHERKNGICIRGNKGADLFVT
jgi:hypothetical protein